MFIENSDYTLNVIYYSKSTFLYFHLGVHCLKKAISQCVLVSGKGLECNNINQQAICCYLATPRKPSPTLSNPSRAPGRLDNWFYCCMLCTMAAGNNTFCSLTCQTTCCSLVDCAGGATNAFKKIYSCTTNGDKDNIPLIWKLSTDKSTLKQRENDLNSVKY